jgi:hypothetical protein
MHDQTKELEAALLEYVERYGLLPKARQYYRRRRRSALDGGSASETVEQR